METAETPINKLEIFNKELAFIKRDDIREYTKYMLEKVVPDYFFEVAASSTGKYHPQYALGQQGLIRHTQAAVRIAKGLFPIMTISADDQDIIIMALILHDSFKHGEDYQKYAIASHPVVASAKIMDAYKNYEVQSQELFEAIQKASTLILTHMGQWNKDWKTQKVLMPKPQSPLQNFVHMCDYLASRKYLEFNFTEEII